MDFKSRDACQDNLVFEKTLTVKGRLPILIHLEFRLLVKGRLPIGTSSRKRYFVSRDACQFLQKNEGLRFKSRYACQLISHQTPLTIFPISTTLYQLGFPSLSGRFLTFFLNCCKNCCSFAAISFRIFSASASVTIGLLLWLPFCSVGLGLDPCA
jgi:hypothetical protein